MQTEQLTADTTVQPKQSHVWNRYRKTGLRVLYGSMSSSIVSQLLSNRANKNANAPPKYSCYANITHSTFRRISMDEVHIVRRFCSVFLLSVCWWCVPFLSLCTTLDYPHTMWLCVCVCVGMCSAKPHRKRQTIWQTISNGKHITYASYIQILSQYPKHAIYKHTNTIYWCSWISTIAEREKQPCWAQSNTFRYSIYVGYVLPDAEARVTTYVWHY